MANTAILAIRIVGDAVDAIQVFQKTEDRTKAMQQTFERSSAIAAGALGLITAAALNVAGAASEAEQAAGAVDSVFGASAETIKGYAADAADAVGLSAQSYNSLASVLGAQLTNMGLAGDQLAGQTDSLIGMGADLAATFGGTTADAVGALSSLLRGERDPIERYGVSIKQADIDARKAALGLTDLTGEAARNADMQATLAILTEQTAAAQGQFARESDTAAGSQQRMTAEWDNARAALGEALLPILTDLTGILSDAAQWVGENTDLVRNLAIGIGVFSAALVIARGAQIAMNIAMAANPVGLLIAAVGAAIGVIALLASNWDAVVAAFGAAGDWLMGVFQAIGDFFAGIFGPIVDGINWVLGAAGDVAEFFGFGGGSVPTRASSKSALPSAATTATAGQQAASTVNNFTINGAIDKDGTARQIGEIVGDRSNRGGRGPGYGGGTQWR